MTEDFESLDNVEKLFYVLGSKPWESKVPWIAYN